ncbi:RHOMBOID-like protein 2 [Ananas comosus]|uniref:RHOMBOID-like protein n=1 Tax=Ananas comosus TaxID=4615 RepID=A0A199V8W5_ANACO|nr:RHOMBOID-like protein 2 [Ananas comosus]
MAHADAEKGGAAGGGKARPGRGYYYDAGNGGGNVAQSPFFYDAAAAAAAAAEAERGWRAWAVPLFAVANVAVFVVAMYVNDCPGHPGNPYGSCVARFLRRFSFQPLRENPLLGPSSSTICDLVIKSSSNSRFRRLEKLGALQWNKVVHRHQGWRLITCMWLHAGLIHIIANMTCLVIIGIRLERQFGFCRSYLFSSLHSTSVTVLGGYLLVRIGTIYLLSGFGGSVLSTLFIRNSISVGASGALFGLLGAMLSELLTNWTLYTHKAGALITLLAMIAINLALGILPHVDNFAHIGGFLTGFLLGFVLLLEPQFAWLERHNLPPGRKVPPRHKAYQLTLLVVALTLVIAGFTVGLIMLFRGAYANDHCHWCHYLSCVPSSRWSCNN